MNTSELSNLTTLFGALSEPTRLRIVRLLASNNTELCVCELVDCLDEPQYHISRHLRELKNSGLLTAERDGRWIYYGLREDALCQSVARLVMELPSEPFRSDQLSFESRMELRSAGRCRIGILKHSLVDESEGLTGAALPPSCIREEIAA